MPYSDECMTYLFLSNIEDLDIPAPERAYSLGGAKPKMVDPMFRVTCTHSFELPSHLSIVSIN